jgi:hypothetical protein
LDLGLNAAKTMIDEGIGTIVQGMENKFNYLGNLAKKHND